MFEKLIDIPKKTEEKFLEIIKQTAEEQGVDFTTVNFNIGATKDGKIEITPYYKGAYQAKKTVKEFLK